MSNSSSNIVSMRRPGKQSREAWVHEAWTDTEKLKPCSAFSLMHVGTGGIRTEIHTIHLGPGKDWNAKKVADCFDGKAHSYAQELAGAQQFLLLAFYGENEPGASHPFIIMGGFGVETTGLMTEEPSAKGATQQHMRLLETAFGVTMRTIMQGQENLLRANDSLLNGHIRLQEMLERARKQEADACEVALNATLELAEKKHSHNLELVKAVQAAKDRELMMKGGMMLMGKATGNQAVTDSLIVETLCERVNTPEELDRFCSMLNLKEEEKAAILMRWTELMKKRREDAERFAKMSDEIAGKIEAKAELE